MADSANEVVRFIDFICGVAATRPNRLSASGSSGKASGNGNMDIRVNDSQMVSVDRPEGTRLTLPAGSEGTIFRDPTKKYANAKIAILNLPDGRVIVVNGDRSTRLRTPSGDGARPGGGVRLRTRE